MKILNLSDTHIGGVNSERRLGNMYADFMLKLDETIKLSKKCDMVIHSGDVFHTSQVSNNIVDDFLDKVEAAKIPWYILPGNHDMIGSNWSTSSGSSLAHIFRRSSLVKILDKLEFENCFIEGFSYNHGIEAKFKDEGIITTSDKKFKIAVTHAFISIKPFRPDVLHVVAKDINTNFDCVLCSHFHHDTGVTRIGNTDFINVGAWGRRTVTEAEHTPKVTIITVGKELSYEIIPLKKAKAGNEVFDLSKKEHEEEISADLDTFVSSLKDFKHQEADIRGNISLVAKEQSLDSRIVDIILNKLTQIEQEA
jgi:DNA repair exonuclease SbcCD nuclease subunit